MIPFQRLVRFLDVSGNVYYGEAGELVGSEDLVGKLVPIFKGTSLWDLSLPKTTIYREVTKTLCPLETTPVIYCVGLNYQHHIQETNSKKPQFPAIFTKPVGTLAGPREDIPIHPECPCIDYEGELCVIIGKTCKNLSENDDPLDYVFGFTVGNDVSCRYWQAPERSSMQATYAKSFDKFCPLGPYIASREVVRDAKCLQLTTRVNGQIRQTAKTDDLIFDPSSIIRFLSRGRTLQPGTVIMTGTPSGVQAGSNSPTWLKNGDVVEVGIEGIGKISNRLIFETPGFQL